MSSCCSFLKKRWVGKNGEDIIYVSFWFTGDG